MKIIFKEDFKGDTYKIIENNGMTVLILYVINNIIIKTSENFATWCIGKNIHELKDSIPKYHKLIRVNED